MPQIGFAERFAERFDGDLGFYSFSLCFKLSFALADFGVLRGLVRSFVVTRIFFEGEVFLIAFGPALRF